MGWVPDDAKDDLGVRLEWPVDEFAEPPKPASPPEESLRPAWLSATPPAETEAPPDVAGTALDHLPGDFDVPGSIGLAAIVARLDSLLAVTTTFRNTLSDRISDYGDQANRLANKNAIEMDENRRALERVLTDVRRSLGGVVDAVGGVREGLDALRADLDAHRESVDASITRLSQEVRSIRRRTTVQARPSAASLDDRQIGLIADAVLAALRADADDYDDDVPASRVGRAVVDDDD